MTSFRLPGEQLPADGYHALDIRTTQGNFGPFGVVGKTEVPLPPGSAIAVHGAPEGIFLQATEVPDPRTGNPVAYPVTVPGFGSIEVVFSIQPEAQDQPGVTNHDVEAGVKAGTMSRSQHPVRLLHPYTPQGVFAAHAENLNDPRIGKQTVADRTNAIVHGVVASSPSVIDPSRSSEPRFATVIPLTQSDPNDPFVEADIMLQVGHSGNEIPPHVIIHSAEDPYDTLRVARIVVGSIAFRSPHGLTGDRRAIDYPGLQWQISALSEPTPAGEIQIDPRGLPAIAALVVTTSCLDVTQLSAPGDPHNLHSATESFGVDPIVAFGGDPRAQRGPRAVS